MDVTRTIGDPVLYLCLQRLRTGAVTAWPSRSEPAGGASRCDGAANSPGSRDR